MTAAPMPIKGCYRQESVKPLSRLIYAFEDRKCSHTSSAHFALHAVDTFVCRCYDREIVARYPRRFAALRGSLGSRRCVPMYRGSRGASKLACLQ